MVIKMGKSYDFIGKRFGKLTVLDRDTQAAGKPWICRCDCGGIKRAATHPLLSGAIKSCGCLKCQGRIQNLAGIRYGSLIVKEQVMGEGKGSAKWLCLCDCGNSCVAAAGNLKSGRTRSCGCLKNGVRKKGMERARRKRESFYIQGTDICQLMQNGRDTRNLRKNNSSGFVGVTYDRSVKLWKASIAFQGKKYYLGASAEKETAIELRETAERILHGGFLEQYKEVL